MGVCDAVNPPSEYPSESSSNVLRILSSVGSVCKAGIEYSTSSSLGNKKIGVHCVNLFSFFFFVKVTQHKPLQCPIAMTRPTNYRLILDQIPVKIVKKVS